MCRISDDVFAFGIFQSQNLCAKLAKLANASHGSHGNIIQYFAKFGCG